MKIINYEPKYREALAQMVDDFNDYIVALDKDGLAKAFDNHEDLLRYTDKLVKDAQELNGFIYLAVLVDKPIGFIQGIVRKSEEELFFSLTHNVGNHGWVGEFYVEKEHRNRGTGKALFEKAMIDLKSKGCLTLSLEVFGYNQESLGVYKSFGMNVRDYVMDMRL